MWGRLPKHSGTLSEKEQPPLRRSRTGGANGMGRNETDRERRARRRARRDRALAPGGTDLRIEALRRWLLGDDAALEEGLASAAGRRLSSPCAPRRAAGSGSP